MSRAAFFDVPGLLARLSRWGDRPALTFYRGKTRDGRLSYGDLVVKVEQLAGGLYRDFGVRRGDRVAILSPNRLEVPVLVLALLRLGAVVVPLNPGAAPEDWAYALGHSEARGLLATRELAARVGTGAKPQFTLNVEDTFAVGAPAPAAEGGLAEQVAVVLYTSGTTGVPKGVALRQRNVLSNAWSMASNFRLDGTTQLAVLPLYHAHAFGFGLMTALSTAGHLVFTERLEPSVYGDVVRAESVTVSSVVPTLLQPLLAAGVTREKAPSLRHLLVSSAPLPGDVAQDFETHTRIRLVHGWGLSEYTNFACCISPDLPPDERARLMFSEEVPSVGPALEGTEVRVVDESGRPMPEGTSGELLVRGHSTMAGYFRDPESTARTVDSDGWLSTGDEGRFRMHAGRPIYFVTGRIKEIIIRDAEKYSPLGLERRLVAVLPELSGRVVVVGFIHHVHGEEVGAYIEIDGLGGELRARLTAAIRAIPVAQRPKVILYGTRAIPRTHTGKIQRRKMQPWFSAFASQRGPVVISEVALEEPVSS